MRLIALCPFGLEKLLKDELKGLGLKSESAAGKVFFEGVWEDVYRANLNLRTAERGGNGAISCRDL
jgi:putative N6-adenine-specific DNA methylase